MRVIDSHVHLYPAEVDIDPDGWAESRGEKHWALLCTRRRRDGRPVQSLPTVDGLLKAMDVGGVARSVLLGWYWEQPDTCAWQNRFYTECIRAHPDRLSAFATVHPAAGREACVEEVRRAHGEGLIGIGELSPHSQGYPVENAAFGEVLTLAEELKMPVNLHAADPASRRYPGWVETPARDFVWLARMFPRTTFVLAHWGGMLPMHDARFKELANVYYDTAASPLLYDEKVWTHAVAVLGEDRVLFGSDYPLNLYPRVSVEAEMARFVAEAKHAGAGAGMLGGNAAGLLGW